MRKLSYGELYRLTNNKDIDLSNLLVDFSKIPAVNSSDITTAETADRFFEKYSIGNMLPDIHKPYERLLGYEILMKSLVDYNKIQYERVHKGTPYYFMGWLSFQIEDFEKGIYYLDSAVSEDIRKIGQDLTRLQDYPGVSFVLLRYNPHQIGLIESLDLIHKFEDQLKIYSDKTGQTFSKDDFIEKFVKPSFFDNSFRTLLTSLYSFILEYDSRAQQLDLRSSEGSSIEPFLTHLLKGGLILESLLKLKPPGDREKTLRPVIIAHNHKLKIDTTVLKGGLTLEEVSQHLLDLESKKKAFQDVCFGVTYGIRNTTGHKLLWKDIFLGDSDIYTRLFRAEVGAIFYSIYRLWIE